MAYVAMNYEFNPELWIFSNGVCRHEQQPMFEMRQFLFLNGVCRHELLSSSLHMNA